MKKIHIIAKTHLDLGFTDFAEKIEKLYFDTFIPKAINLSQELNTDKNRFIWTTGSWIIKKALTSSTSQNKAKLENALRKGNIKPHGLPFTTHTELLDEDTLRYGLEIAQKIKNKYGFNISAAKMTDVPGHTKALVPLLAEYNIKLLHIGVNDSSALPDVPQAFLWKFHDKEVIVLYEGSYGSLYKNEYIDDILYFAHSHDNDGPNSKDNMLSTIDKLQKQFPDYEVIASSLDDYAEEIWKAKDKLPVITSEIGDSWIHGAATDPYKSAAIRELIELKNNWLDSGKIKRDSNEYNNLADCILMLCEHTWGMDVKKHLSDLGIYLKEDFNKARNTDNVKLKYNKPFTTEWRNTVEQLREQGVYNEGSYKKIEESWQEQRNYIKKAIINLPYDLKKEAEERLDLLIPKNGFDKSNSIETENRVFQNDSYYFEINELGGIKTLTLEGNEIIKDNLNSAIDYCSFSASDYDYFLQNYSRNVQRHKVWVIPDFARPLLHEYDNKYPTGIFNYKLSKLFHIEEEDKSSFIALLQTDKKVNEELGAPRTIEIKYSITKSIPKFTQEVIWLGKDASRLTEALYLHFNFSLDDNSIKYKKLGKLINPLDIVKNGNRNLSAVESVYFKVKGVEYILKNYHSPLVSLGKGKILKYNNIFENPQTDGISFVMHNNVWGTNFPLWYSDNAYFKFELKNSKD